MKREDCPQCAGFGCHWCGDLDHITEGGNMVPDHAGEATDMVSCPACGSKHKDGSADAEFIGWDGACVLCQC